MSRGGRSPVQASKWRVPWRTGARWKWAALAGGLAVGVFLVWFFLFRAPASNPTTPAFQPPARPALGKTLSYSAYTAAAERALSEVRQGRGLAGDERKKRLESAAAALEGVEGAQVSTGASGAPTGGAAQVDNTALIAALRASDPDVEALENNLAALAGTLRARSGAPARAGTLGGEQANAELRRVLADPLFDYERGISPIERLIRWLTRLTGEADPANTLWRWLTSLVAGIACAAGAYLLSERLGSRWVRLVFSAAAGLAGGIVYYAAVGNLGDTARALGAVGFMVAAIALFLVLGGLRRASAPSSPRAVSELAAALGMGAGTARSRARQAADEGDYRLAVRYRCLAVLLALDEVGRLTFDRAATDREYLFRAPGPLQSSLQPLLERFEATWYGEQGIDVAGWQQYDAQAAEIEAAVAAAETHSTRAAQRGTSAA